MDNWGDGPFPNLWISADIRFDTVRFGRAKPSFEDDLVVTELRKWLRAGGKAHVSLNTMSVWFHVEHSEELPFDLDLSPFCRCDGMPLG